MLAANLNPDTDSHTPNQKPRGILLKGLDIQLKAHLELSGAFFAMLLLVDGEIIFDWGETSKKLIVHSIRKSLLNSLYGIAVSKGIIDTTMTLRELDISDIEPGLSENERDARIADLLKSRSGVYHHAAGVSKGMLMGMPDPRYVSTWRIFLL